MAVENEIVHQLFLSVEKGIYLTSEETAITGNSVFAIIRGKHFPQKLKIRAVLHGQEQDVDLIYMPKYFYRVEVPSVGTFYFSVNNSSKIFSRNKEGEIVKLSLLEPINVEQFEEACRVHRFFFVG